MPQSPNISQFRASPPGHIAPAAWALEQRRGFDPYAIPLTPGTPWFDGVTFVVRAAFSTNPMAVPAWNDISPYVRSVSIRHGRTSELQTYQAGVCQIELDNSDRRFDPTYAAGPYYPNVLPMRRINVQAYYGGVLYDLFTGYADGWPQSYEKPAKATVVLTVTDGFKALANVRLSDSVYAIEVRRDTPSAWYRLGEQAGNVMSDASGNARHGVFQGGAVFGTRTGLIKGSTDNAIGFDGVDDAGILTVDADPILGFPFSVEAWIVTENNSISLPSTIVDQAQNFWRLTLSHSTGIPGDITATVSSSGASASARTSNAIGYGPTRYVNHVVAVFPAANAVPIIYINGSVAPLNVASVSGAGVVWEQAQTRIAGSAINIPFTYTAETLDEVAFYNTVLSPARVSAHYAAGTNPWNGDDTGTRITRILDQIGWPAVDRNIAQGNAVLGPTTIENETALDLLKRLETTEQGYVFMDAAGKVVFQNRYQRLLAAASTTSQFTFNEAFTEITLPYSDTTIANRVKVDRVGSTTTIEAVDQASIGTYFERTVLIGPIESATDGEASDLAYWYLGHYSQPIVRIDAMTVKPRKDPTVLFPQVLGRTFGDRVTAVRLPQGIAPAITKEVHLEGIQHTITPSDWQTEFYLSPADTTGVFVLDGPVYGLLDANRLGF